MVGHVPSYNYNLVHLLSKLECTKKKKIAKSEIQLNPY